MRGAGNLLTGASHHATLATLALLETAPQLLGPTRSQGTWHSLALCLAAVDAEMQKMMQQHSVPGRMWGTCTSRSRASINRAATWYHARWDFSSCTP